MRARLSYGFALLLLVVGAGPATAQDADQGVDSTDVQSIREELAQLRQELEDIEQRYDERLAVLEAQLASGAPAPPAAQAPPTAPTAVQVPAGAAGAGGPGGSLPLYGNAAATTKIFNPDIAIIGDFLGAAGTNDVNPSPGLAMHESEASLQAIVDPYARGDFFIAFGEEGVDLEEGYITFQSLPAGLLLKGGKLREAFGKVNTMHSHVLPWTDRPLVVENLLGGDEGLADAGLSVSRIVPNPWIFLEATGEVYRGDAGEVFAGSRRGDLSWLGRLRGYQDITESTNLDLGFSVATGKNDAGPDFRTSLYGVDATFRYRPLRRAIYRSLVARSEVVWSRRDEPVGRRDANGFYLSGDYQFARRWFAGVRYDRSERADDPGARDTGQSLVLTYWPSEFNQVRFQYRRTRYAEARTANELLFQFQFSIGAHGAHAF